MLNLNFQQFASETSPDEMAHFVETVTRVAKQSAIAATEKFVRSIGFSHLPQPDSYYQEALNYYLGHLFAFLNRPDDAAQHIRLSRALPGPGGSPPFSEHQLQALLLSREQDAAMERGIPSIIMSSMPRAASATLALTLSQHVGLPVLRGSAGDFPDYWLIPIWMSRIINGGALLHDHFSASAFNLGVLADFGVKKVVVLVRDPRQAAASIVALGLTAENVIDPEVSFEEKVWSAYTHRYLPWVRQWLDAADRGNVEVTWIRSTDVIADVGRVVRSLCLQLSENHPALGEYAERPVQPAIANLVSGDPEGWRRKIPEDLQNEMWHAMPNDIRDLLHVTR